MTNNLQLETHDINTASIERYFSTPLQFQGSGQGNDTGPTVQVMTSAILRCWYRCVIIFNPIEISYR